MTAQTITFADVPIIVINLPTRTDRIDRFMNDAAHLHARVLPSPGVPGATIDPAEVARFRARLDPGNQPRAANVLGCLRAHHLAVTTALTLGAHWSLICEDDADLSTLPETLTLPPDTGLALLGGRPVPKQQTLAEVPGFPGWRAVTRWYGAYAYLADRTALRSLGAAYGMEYAPTDWSWWSVMAMVPTVAAYPALVGHHDGWSDIRQRDRVGFA